ncbi:MAG: type VI secretion system tip protein TssI/VgrG [Polyangiaceae bacterium]
MATGIDLALSCSAISDDAILLSAHVTEAISEPTRATVVFLATTDIDGEAVVGQPATLTFLHEGKPFRHFQLVAAGFTFDALVGESRRRYVLDLTHELRLLSLRSDVRIFQEKDAKQIITEVIEGAGLDPAHYTFSLRRTPPTRVYDVQYRETDLDYVSRLAEHEGIFYFANDDDASSHVTFGDNQSVFEPIDEDVLTVVDDDEHGDGISDLVVEEKVIPKSCTVADYNFETPAYDLRSTQETGLPTAGDYFEYTASFQKPDEGTALAKIRAEEQAAAQCVARGRTERRSVRAGGTFRLEGADRDALNTKYLITAVRHRVVVRAETGAEGRTHYENKLTAIPHDRAYRPPRRAPHPKMGGVHAAVVTGPAGSEIHTEDLGRMKAQSSGSRRRERRHEARRGCASISSRCPDPWPSRA